MAQAPNKSPLTDKDVLKVGDRVIVDKDKKGQIRWVGEHKALGIGTWYGIRLVEKRGVCDGTFKEVKFFWCPEGFGVVIQRKRITARYTAEDFDFSTETEPVKVDPGLELIRQKRKEVQRLKARFKKLDKDGNLLIDVKEFGNLVVGKEGLFPKMTDGEVKKLFDEIDVTKSGTMSYAEFDSWVKSLGGVHVMEHKDFVKIRDQFQTMDKDGDKQITMEEFLSVTCKLFPKLTQTDAKQLFTEIDTSGNGTIEFQEYDTWVKKQEGGADSISN